MIKQRILEFLNHLNIGQSAFEKKVGVGNGYVNNIKKSIGSDVIHKILTIYPELDTEWLVTGNGEMLKNINREDTNNNVYTYYNELYAYRILEETVTKNQDIIINQQTIINKQFNELSEMRKQITELITKIK